MFNIFGALGALGRFLPGYIQGREQAISSNWGDMKNYNTVQHGQLQNAWDELNFPLNYNQNIDAASMSRDKAQLSQLGLAQEMALFPMRLAVGAQQAQGTLSGNMNPGGVGGAGGGQGGQGGFGFTPEMWEQLGRRIFNNFMGTGGQNNPAPTEANMPTTTQR